MVIDYEQAWVRLQDFAASKPQHGREGLLREMATIAAECRVPAGELSKLLRLYGVEVERVRGLHEHTDREELTPSAADSFGNGMTATPAPIDREVTDGITRSTRDRVHA